MNRVGAILCGEEPGAAPASVLFVQGSNPAATAPDQRTMLRGLAREDVFTVVHDQVMTDTARFADVVLPATTHFEADDVAVSYGTYVLQTVPAVIDRVGESRTNNELAAALAARLGLDPAEFDPDPAVLLARMAAGAGRAGRSCARPVPPSSSWTPSRASPTAGPVSCRRRRTSAALPPARRSGPSRSSARRQRRRSTASSGVRSTARRPLDEPDDAAERG